MPDEARQRLPICDLCDDYPGSLFDMSRACCVARWMKRQPPHFDRNAFFEELRESHGEDFVRSVHGFWGMVE